MPEQFKLILKHVDAPGYTPDIACYMRHGGYEALKLALATAPRDLPDGKKENTSLALYAEAVRGVAKKHGLTFVDFFGFSRARYAKKGQPALTINGFAPTEAGYQELGAVLADGAFGKTPRKSRTDAALMNAAVKEKDYFWNNDYNLVNGVHTHGQRYDPFGPQNYPDELQ